MTETTTRVPHHTILVTDGEQRAALAAVRSFGAAGYTVHVASASRRSIAGASRFATRAWQVPDALEHPTEFADAIRHIARETGADMVIPISEASLLAILPMRETLTASVPFADEATFRAISHKGIVLEAAQQVGIATPDQLTVNTAADAPALPFDALSYPLVVKPARSVAEGTGEERAKFAIQHAASADELRTIIRDIDARAYPLLLQQRIVGPGVGIFILLWNGELLAAFSHQRVREKPPAGGISVYRISRPMDAGLLAKSRALLDAFQWNGVAMVEYKVDERTGTPYLMEINGRFWGSLQLAIDAGVDFPHLLVAAASGEAPAPVTSYDTNVRSRWFFGDLDHVLIRLRRSAQALALPPGSPSKMATVRAFFRRDPRDRDEIRQSDDPGPFRRERAQYISQLLGQ